MKDRLTLMIHTCDKFSDLWDAHMFLLNRNWADRGIDTFLITDEETIKTYDGVRVISTGSGKELSERTAAALPEIKTEYVLITLDDYFPIHPILSDRIERLVNIMDNEGLDYIRLFCDPNSHKKLCSYPGLYHIPLDCNYAVNLYQGIWRSSFLEKTVREPLNAWQYEVSLTKIAREIGAKCALSKGKEFEILDVVRKGKLLHKANRYLKKHDLYHGPRVVIARKEEIRICIFNNAKKLLPKWVAQVVKRVMIKCGYHFYSGESL